jgi:hypothetical protein
MTFIGTTTPQSIQRERSGFVQGARLVYYGGTAIFLGGIVLQIFLAGAALLVDSAYLNQHRMFAHILELFAIILPLLALISRQPWRITLASLLPFFLIGMQYVILWALDDMGLPAWTRGLHAVNALVIYWLMLCLSRSAWQLWHTSSK